MTQYLSKRLAEVIPVLLLASVIVFWILFKLPGDPVAFMLGDKGTPAQVAAMRANLGLDDPLPIQYVQWLGRIATLDFGKSLINDFPVKELLKRRIPATLELSVGALTVAILSGFPLGILAAVYRRRSWLVRLVSSFNAFALAIPVFWLGLLLALFVGLRLQWLPPTGYVPFMTDPIASIRHMILPSITLGLAIGAILARFLQSALIEAYQEDFVRTAHAKGLSQQATLFRHILKNALIPVVTMLGLQFGTIMGGAVITEAVFNIPGIGNMLWTAIMRRDYFVIQSVIMLILVTFVAVNLLTDVLYALLDPRIRLGEDAG